MFSNRFYFILFYLFVGSLFFTKCNAAVGNFIYIDSVNLPSLITNTSFSYEYSLAIENDLMGRTIENDIEKLIPLRIYLCPLRSPKPPSELSDGKFDCDEGCVEYLVSCFTFPYFCI
jgi:hypothetical protein